KGIRAMSTLAEVIDLEEYAKSGRRPPKAKHYRIKVDKESFTVDVAEMTGRQILELAKKNPPERFKLFEHHHGGKTEHVELDKEVDFTTPGVEKFKTLPI